MNKSPKPMGPYSQAVVVNGFVFSSGQIAVNPETGKLVCLPKLMLLQQSNYVNETS